MMTSNQFRELLWSSGSNCSSGSQTPQQPIPRLSHVLFALRGYCAANVLIAVSASP